MKIIRGLIIAIIVCGALIISLSFVGFWVGEIVRPIVTLIFGFIITVQSSYLLHLTKEK